MGKSPGIAAREEANLVLRSVNTTRGDRVSQGPYVCLVDVCGHEDVAGSRDDHVPGLYHGFELGAGHDCLGRASC